jgi:hypothetical protein
MGQFFTGADIRRLAKAKECRYLLLAPEDRITAEAMYWRSVGAVRW